jgi:hypothetical protein
VLTPSLPLPDLPSWTGILELVKSPFTMKLPSSPDEPVSAEAVNANAKTSAATIGETNPYDRRVFFMDHLTTIAKLLSAKLPDQPRKPPRLADKD